MPTKVEEIIVPLGRRIGEIMEEKGDAFSYRAFGERIGMGKDTLSRCINGERYIKPSELIRICEGLNISEARLKQEDILREIDELGRLMDAQVNHKRSVFLAENWAKVAIGMTERCMSLNVLGKAYHDSLNYEKAHAAWLDAYSYARQVNERYGENKLLHRVILNLMISFTVRKEYIKMSEILEEAKNEFSHLPEFMGGICFSKAQLAEQLGDISEAKRIIYQSLEYFLIAGNPFNIARAMINVAHYEFRSKNYGKAKRYLEDALDKLGEDRNTRLFTLKEYAKVLSKIGDFKKAQEVIYQALEYEEIREVPDLHAKFYILLSLVEQKVDYALKVFEDEDTSDKMRYFACIQLMNHYKVIGDGVSLLRYYEIAETLVGCQLDILDTEGF